MWEQWENSFTWHTLHQILITVVVPCSGLTVLILSWRKNEQLCTISNGFCLCHYTFEVSRFSHYRRNRRFRVVLISYIVFILSCNECNVMWILEPIRRCARQRSTITHKNKWKPAESTCYIFNYPMIILVTHVKSRWLAWAARQTKAFNFRRSGGTGGLADKTTELTAGGKWLKSIRNLPSSS